MKRILLLALAVGLTLPASGQTDVRDRIMDHFNGSVGKMVRLSEAMPSELYSWAPSEGTMTVAEVYAHIARYNFMYLEENLGIPAPEGIDLDTMESETDKEVVRDLLLQSVEHVRKHVPAMTEEALAEETTLYGRAVSSWAVLMQLVAHMNEHVGQAVAYARFNGVVPPWSS
ncbi:MAG: DinB family protein [Rhodothermales bacterium]|nr:DinB family protein [Rhodothermales bacterium]MBO6780656.1 DinB family protein [Rhodothermales bacterium]